MMHYVHPKNTRKEKKMTMHKTMQRKKSIKGEKDKPLAGWEWLLIIDEYIERIYVRQ